jgi:2-polyprenyl-6-methoxyphenol hydroxylase-like FAD-dependent oxidoreductase
MSSGRLPETLIIGGGIGGLSAALCLARRGGAVTVLERSKSFAEVGAGIQLAPNATRILDRLGVLERILPLAVLPRRLVLADAIESRELTSLELTDFPSRYGAPYLVLHRGDLLSALLDGCVQSGVELRTSVTVTEVTDAGGQAVAVCADGREFSAEVAIGADGLHSRIRRYFTDDEPVNSGFVAYRGAVPMDQVERHADLRDVVAWIGPGLHLVQYPLRSGQMYNQVAVFQSRAYLRGEADWGNPAELTAAFGGCSEHVRESLKTLSIANRWPMLDRPPMPHWARGRVALLGDAAHPMLQYLAQGACQAVEDSAALAAALAAAGNAGRPFSEGLASYAAARAPQAMRVQRAARTWGEIWHVDGVAKLIRDQLLLDRDATDHKHVRWLYQNGAAAPGRGGEALAAGAAPRAQHSIAGQRHREKESAP